MRLLLLAILDNLAIPDQSRRLINLVVEYFRATVLLYGVGGSSDIRITKMGLNMYSVVSTTTVFLLLLIKFVGFCQPPALNFIYHL